MSDCGDLLPPDEELVGREYSWICMFKKWSKVPSGEILDWNEPLDDLPPEEESANESISEIDFVDVDYEDDPSLLELASRAKAKGIDRAASWNSKGVVIKMQSRPFSENIDSWLLKNTFSYHKKESRRDVKEKEEYSIVKKTISTKDKNTNTSTEITTQTFTLTRTLSSVRHKTSGSSEITIGGPSLSILDSITKRRSRNRHRDERSHRRHRKYSASSSSSAGSHCRKLIPKSTRATAKKQNVTKKDSQQPLHIESSSDSDVFLGPNRKSAETPKLQLDTSAELNRVHPKAVHPKAVHPIGKYKEQIMELANNGKTFDKPQLKDAKLKKPHSMRSKTKNLPIEILSNKIDNNFDNIVGLKDFGGRQAEIVNEFWAEETNSCKTRSEKMQDHLPTASEQAATNLQRPSDFVAETEKSAQSTSASLESLPKNTETKNRKKKSQATASHSSRRQKSKKLEHTMEDNENYKENGLVLPAVCPKSFTATSFESASKSEQSLQLTSGSSGSPQDANEIAAKNIKSPQPIAASSDSLQTISDAAAMAKKSSRSVKTSLKNRKGKERSPSKASSSISRQNFKGSDNKMDDSENHKENGVDLSLVCPKSFSATSFEYASKSEQSLQLTSGSSGSLQDATEIAARSNKTPKSIKKSSDSLQPISKAAAMLKKLSRSVKTSLKNLNLKGSDNKLNENGNHKENCLQPSAPRSTSVRSLESVSQSKQSIQLASTSSGNLQDTIEIVAESKRSPASSDSLQQVSDGAAIVKKSARSTKSSANNEKTKKKSSQSKASSSGSKTKSKVFSDENYNEDSQDNPNMTRPVSTATELSITSVAEAEHEFKKPMVPVKRKNSKKYNSILSTNGTNITCIISNDLKSHGIKKSTVALRNIGDQSYGSTKEDISSSSITKSRNFHRQPNTSSKISNISSALSNNITVTESILNGSYGSARKSAVLYSPQKKTNSFNLSSKNVNSQIVLSVREIAKIANLDNSRCLKFLGKNVKLDDTIKLDPNYRYTFVYPENSDDSHDSDDDDLDFGSKNRGCIIKAHT